jgi:CDP-2,3-bis-(O-geranylgeranyl)-sn-glycerol synthase
MELLYLLQLVYFFVPGYVANAAPAILFRLFPQWNAPMDFKRTWRGRRILGDHKTWRGALGGTLFAGLFFLLQQWLATRPSAGLTTQAVPFLPYSQLPWWFGFLMGFGAIVLGDAGKSFFKRRLGIPPGKSWFPFDQIDYTLGAFIACAWLFWPGFGFGFEAGWASFVGWFGLLFLLVINSVIAMLAHAIAGALRITKERF